MGDLKIFFVVRIFFLILDYPVFDTWFVRECKLKFHAGFPRYVCPTIISRHLLENQGVPKIFGVDKKGSHFRKYFLNCLGSLGEHEI